MRADSGKKTGDFGGLQPLIAISEDPLARPAALLPHTEQVQASLNVVETLPNCCTPQAFPAEIQGPAAWVQPLPFHVFHLREWSTLQSGFGPEQQAGMKTLFGRKKIQVGCRR